MNSNPPLFQECDTFCKISIALVGSLLLIAIPCVLGCCCYCLCCRVSSDQILRNPNYRRPTGRTSAIPTTSLLSISPGFRVAGPVFGRTASPPSPLLLRPALPLLSRVILTIIRRIIKGHFRYEYLHSAASCHLVLQSLHSCLENSINWSPILPNNPSFCTYSLFSVFMFVFCAYPANNIFCEAKNWPCNKHFSSLIANRLPLPSCLPFPGPSLCSQLFPYDPCKWIA